MGREELLLTEKLTKDFGGLRAVDHVDLVVRRGEIHGIIGPNGAGKTTLFNLITGYLRPTEGRILFKGKRIEGLPPHRIVYLGIARTFQIVRPFTELSVLENVLVAWGHRHYGGMGPFLPYSRERRRAMEILEEVGLSDRAHLPAGTLPIGHQRRLEIARAMALEPELMLLDEPAAGLTEEEISELKGVVRSLVDRGITVVLVEHRMTFVMDICGIITVRDHGRVIAEGAPEEVAHDPAVIEAYLGAGSADASG